LFIFLPLFLSVSDPVWQTKLAIRQLFDSMLNTCVSYHIVSHDCE